MRLSNKMSIVMLLAVAAVQGCGAENSYELGDSGELDASLLAAHAVTSFSIVDASNDKPLTGYAKVSGDVKLDAALIANKKITVVAAVTSATKSLRFDYNNQINYRAKNRTPHSLFGDSNGNLFGNYLALGIHKVVATPFPQANLRGSAGTPATLTITIADQTLPPPPPVVTTIPLITPRRTYVMQAIDSENVNLTTLAKAEGIVLRTRWSTIEPAPGQFNLTWLKAQIARAQNAGKYIQLEVLSGDDSPAWLEAQGAQIFKFSTGQIPVPWDAVFQERYKQMISHIRANLDWKMITHFHTIGADNAEWHYNQMDNGAFYKVAGYSDAKMVDAHVRAVQTLKNTLTNVIIVCDIGDHTRPWTSQAIAQLKEKFRGFVAFQMDSLKANTSTTYDGYTRIRDAAAEGHHAGFEMVGPSVDSKGAPVDRFGGSFDASIALADQTKAQWLIVYQADL